MGPNGYSGDGDEAARLTRVKERAQLARNANQSNAEAMQEDLLFLVGGDNQWDPKARRDRIAARRPIYTGNRFPAMLAQITGEIRKNKPGIKCSPGDAAATTEAARIMEGLVRNIERMSFASLVYARAGKSAAACGAGHWRIVPVYEDDEGFDTGLRIRAIKNVHSVLRDPNCQSPDHSDAQWCIVESTLGKKDFEEAYPQVGAAAWTKATAGLPKIDGWRSGENDKVTVAEEWIVKKEPYERYQLVHSLPFFDGQGIVNPTGETVIVDGDIRKGEGADTIDGEDAGAFMQAAEAQGFTLVQQRTAYKKTVCFYLWGGEKQIAGPIEWHGDRIPIFTVLGEEIDAGEDTVVHGMIRHAKDAQRLFNYARSSDLELVSQAPKAPIIAADEQLDGYEDEWALAQTQPVPYLRYKYVNGLPAPQERNGPGTNPGPSQLAQSGIVDMQDVVGIHDASLGKKSNETSGVAIEARDEQADTGTFVYIDNLNYAVEATGQELVAAAPHYYSAREQILILGEDDAPEIINLAQNPLPAKGKYHVIARRGPSHQTKREKAANQYIEMSRAAPEWAQPIIFKRVAKLTDMEDADDFIAELDAVGQMVGALPPPMNGAAPGMPGMPMPGAPGGPGQPLPPGALPPNVVPMPPRGAPQQPPPADPLAGVELPLSPPRAPAARTRVGPPMGAPPGM